MSNLSENFKSSYKNFKQYAYNGTVPAETQKDLSMVPQNCFYESVDHINNVVGPVKNVTCNTIAITTGALTNIVLQPLYLAFAYLSYWPAKGLAKVTDKFSFEEKSLVDYSNTLSEKALEHSGKVADFVKTVLSYAVSAIIWTAALIVTPLTWAVDKVSSKFNETKTEGMGDGKNPELN
ncbi:MAG: hypothetical protein LBC06_03375 [Rickettsiales bacterium]|jgi:hypothetical protein|nr:hypothetical protein [Rickettsiales bacterium]